MPETTTAPGSTRAGGGPAAGDRCGDLRRVEQAITGISRIGSGKASARLRSERSGVRVSRPGVAILAALAHRGELRVNDLARQTGLEVPLVSREVNRLAAEGRVLRRSDDSDGRAALVSLTEQGRADFGDYRRATDEIIGETFAAWEPDELHRLAATLERVLADFSRRPGGGHPG